MKYSNPVIPGFYPDPSICRVDEDYYLVTSSFEYFPGVPIFHSRDLVNWRQIGHCLTRRSQLELQGTGSSGGIFAPTIRYHDGRFYMVTTHRGNFYVHTDNPTGKWSERIEVDQAGIDPSLLFDSDGKVYFISNNLTGKEYGIYQSELDIETGRRLTKGEHLWNGTGGKYPEAPHMYKINGYYYLMLAEGGTEYGHMITIARSRDPHGPFESCPHNPILSNRSTDQGLQCTGHGDLVQDHKGNWWIVFLAVRTVGYPPCYHMGRETCLAPVRWDDQGWPVIMEDGQVPIDIESNCLPAHPWPDDPIRDDFDSDKLSFCWNFRRNLDPADWSLTERPGSLRLSCSPNSLNTNGEPPAFVGRRQCHFRCRAATRIDFTPATESEEAGLTVIMNEKHHYEIAVTLREGMRVVIVRRRIGFLAAEVACAQAGEGPITLQISATSAQYSFAFVDNGDLEEIARSETRYLSTEVAGGFSGVLFGMYATANNEQSKSSAYFDWFDYEPVKQ